MSSKKTILIISGSTRQKSINQSLIDVIVASYADQLNFKQYKHLAELPHFNVDLDTPDPPALIVDLRKELKSADAVLICSPEYAMGVPGSLKNLLDWTVSSSAFSQKLVGVITASTSGIKAHESLIGTLQVIEAVVDEDTTLLISHAKAKIKDTPEIVDPDTAYAVNGVMKKLMKLLTVENN
jgi:NAD(P)H-dependent FMN reductase